MPWTKAIFSSWDLELSLCLRFTALSPLLAVGALLLSGWGWEVRSVIQNTSSGTDGDMFFLLVLQLKRCGKSSHLGFGVKFFYHLRDLGPHLSSMYHFWHVSLLQGFFFSGRVIWSYLLLNIYIIKHCSGLWDLPLWSEWQWAGTKPWLQGGVSGSEQATSQVLVGPYDPSPVGKVGSPQ